jgi:hypothetical protein
MRLGTAQRLPGRFRSLGINTPAILKSEAAGSCTTAPLLEVLFIVQQRAYYEITNGESHFTENGFTYRRRSTGTALGTVLFWACKKFFQKLQFSS